MSTGARLPGYRIFAPPEVGRPIPSETGLVRLIFYLPVSGGIFICRVLHRRMLVEYEDFLSSFSESIE